MKKDLIQYLKDTFDLPDEEVQEFLNDFYTSLDDCCGKLKEEQNNVNFANLRVITHTLIGFCENMGAHDLASAAKELNTAAKAADVPQCKEKILCILSLNDAYHD